jgi:hypothetical protein
MIKLKKNLSCQGTCYIFKNMYSMLKIEMREKKIKYIKLR